MPRDVLAPFSDGVSTGVVLAWRCRVGDHVRAGEVLAEIEMDKANLELEAPEDGVVLQLGVAVGQSFDRATPLLRLEPRPLSGPSDLERNPVTPVVPIRVVAPEVRCKFCQALRVAGRLDCARCGAPL